MSDTSMLQAPSVYVKREIRSPTPVSASPYPFQQQQQMMNTNRAIAMAAPMSSVAPMAMSSTGGGGGFDLDFLDPVGSSGLPLANPALSHTNSGDVDLNLLSDPLPVMHTLPGESHTGASGSGLPMPASSIFVTAPQQPQPIIIGSGPLTAHHQHTHSGSSVYSSFSDASSEGSAASPDHPGLSPGTSSFGSSPASPISPASPVLHPQQLLYTQTVQSGWALAAPPLTAPNPSAVSGLPLPMYPLSAATATTTTHTQTTTVIKQQNSSAVAAYSPNIYGQIKKSASPIPFGAAAGGANSNLPQPAPRSAANAAPVAATAAAAAGKKPAAAAAGAGPKATKGASTLPSEKKGRRGGKTKLPSPAGSDDEDSPVAGGEGSGEEKGSKKERNKQSAMKYRKRRKVYLDGLEAKVGDLNDTVSSLNTENKLLKEQLEFLKNLLSYKNGGVLPDSVIKFGDTSKPASHAANQPPPLPKIARVSQQKHPLSPPALATGVNGTLALFCVLACVMLCVTSPDAFFGMTGPTSSHVGVTTATGAAGLVHAPPSDDSSVRRSRVLLEHTPAGNNCVCPTKKDKSAAAAAGGSGSGGGGATDSVLSTADADSNGSNNGTASADGCICSDDESAADAEHHHSASRHPTPIREPVAAH